MNVLNSNQNKKCEICKFSTVSYDELINHYLEQIHPLNELNIKLIDSNLREILGLPKISSSVNLVQYYKEKYHDINEINYNYENIEKIENKDTIEQKYQNKKFHNINEINYEIHSSNNESKIQITKDDKNFIEFIKRHCDICEKPIEADYKDYALHVMKYHNSFFLNDYINDKFIGDFILKGGDLSEKKCEICHSMIPKSISDYYHHIKNAHGNLINKNLTKYIKDKYLISNLLKINYYEISKTAINCDLCGEEVYDQQDFNNHKLLHKKIKNSLLLTLKIIEKSRAASFIYNSYNFNQKKIEKNEKNDKNFPIIYENDSLYYINYSKKTEKKQLEKYDQDLYGDKNESVGDFFLLKDEKLQVFEENINNMVGQIKKENNNIFNFENQRLNKIINDDKINIKLGIEESKNLQISQETFDNMNKEMKIFDFLNEEIKYESDAERKKNLIKMLKYKVIYFHLLLRRIKEKYRDQMEIRENLKEELENLKQNFIKFNDPALHKEIEYKKLRIENLKNLIKKYIVIFKEKKNEYDEDCKLLKSERYVINLKKYENVIKENDEEFFLLKQLIKDKGQNNKDNNVNGSIENRKENDYKEISIKNYSINQKKLNKDNLNNQCKEKDFFLEEKFLSNKLDFPRPIEWENQNDYLQIIDLKKNSHEYISILNHFLNTLPANITKIKRIQNKTQWKNYCFSKYKLGKKGNETEKLLFYGTGQIDPMTIITDDEDGIDIRFADQRCFGNALYFHERASYADKNKFSMNNCNFLILAKVLVGEFVKLSKNNPYLKLPPLKSKQEKERYDSVYNDGEYVIYSNYRAYPAYLLEYI